MKEKSRQDGVEPIEIEKLATIRSLNLDDLQGVFYLVLLALLGSLLVFILEVLKGWCGTVVQPSDFMEQSSIVRLGKEPAFMYY